MGPLSLSPACTGVCWQRRPGRGCRTWLLSGPEFPGTLAGSLAHAGLFPSLSNEDNISWMVKKPVVPEGDGKLTHEVSSTDSARGKAYDGSSGFRLEAEPCLEDQ